MTLEKRAEILLIEDNPADADLVEEALTEADIQFGLKVLGNGRRALDFIDGLDRDGLSCPDLILLDLNLPMVNGLEVLKRIRSSRACGNVKVLIVTSSNAVTDRQRAMELGATDYFRKPSSLELYMQLGPKVRSMLQG